MLQDLKSFVPNDSAYDVRVEEVTPRAKDGGAFVKFSWVLPTPPYEVDGIEEPDLKKKEEERVLKILEQEAVRPSLAFKLLLVVFLAHSPAFPLADGRDQSEEGEIVVGHHRLVRLGRKSCLLGQGTNEVRCEMIAS